MTASIHAFPGAPSPEELLRFPWNDLGNSQRLIRLVGGRFDDDGLVDHRAARLLYLRNRGWIAFNGRHWDLAAGEEIARRWTHKVAGGLHAQSEAMREERDDRGKPVWDKLPKAWLDFVNRTGSSGSSGAMLAQAASYLTVDLDDFDRDPLALNVANGTVKFRRGEGGWKVAFSPVHDPGDRMTRICGAKWEPKAACPQFDRFLSWCQPQAEMAAYLQSLAGYMATGLTKEQLFIILQGKGGDGKSTLVNALRHVLHTYAVTAAVETFLDTGMKRSGEASPDIARLAGDTRLICTAEPPRGSKLATGAIKSFTGGGTIVARELRQGIFEFEPTGKVVIECNGRPAINDTDDGIWRRIRILLFERQLKEHEIDKDLPAKLEAEASGILNWLIAGVISYLQHGLPTPEKVRGAIEDYRRGSNPFAQWWADRVILEPEAVELAGDLYRNYKDWCEANGHERPMTQTTFGRALGDMQILLCGKDSTGRVRRKGAKLRADYDHGAGDLMDPDRAPHPLHGPGGLSAADLEALAPGEADWREGE